MFLTGFFHWVYCLPIPWVLALTVLATLFFLVLDRRLTGRPWRRAVPGLLLGVSAAVMLWQTVLGRTPGPQPPPVRELFASYRLAFLTDHPEILRSNLMNVLLFYPAGLFSVLLFRGRRMPWLRRLLIPVLFFLLSFGIEYLQYRLQLGIFELDDIFHNTLGVLLAQALCPGLDRLLRLQDGRE